MRQATILVLLVILSVASLAIAPFWGVTPLDELLQPGDAEGVNIFWDLRVPRVVMAFLAGAGLAISGMAFQAIFRNPLATPFTLGTASGASLGAAVGIYLGWSVPLLATLSISTTSLWAFAGCVVAILIVYGLTRARRGFSTATMLLAGVAVSFFFSSLILLLQYVTDPSRAFRILRWVMGGFGDIFWSDVVGAAPFVVSGSLIVLCLTHELNLLATGEDLATSRGVEVVRVKKTLFFAVSLMVGGIVAICGPIGFVGLMVPHICRLLIGADHRVLTPATVLFGGSFLVLCDALARTAFGTQFPLGIITALLGGPFFIWLLLSRRVDV